MKEFIEFVVVEFGFDDLNGLGPAHVEVDPLFEDHVALFKFH